MDSAGHLRSHSEFRKGLSRTPYLPDTSIVYTVVRVPKQLLEARQSLSPRKMARSMMLSDSGSDMHRLVSERKETSAQLLAMENRIKALQWAEAQAQKKLEETKKLADEKAALVVLKHRESEEKQQWRETMEKQRLAEKLKFERERAERRQRLKQVREVYYGMKKESAVSVRQESRQKLAALQSFIQTEQARKERRRLEQTFEHRKMQSALEASGQVQRHRVASMFQEKKETERQLKVSMEQRIKELEKIEMRIIDNLKKTYAYHEGEVARFEKIVSGAKTDSQSSQIIYKTQECG